MNNISSWLFNNGLQPHGWCIAWDPALLWSMVASDALIAAAYFSIPLTILYFYRKRQDPALRVVALLFSLFIVSCGLTHVLEIWTLWSPVYGLQAATKVVTALTSVFTALALWQMMPRGLRVPSVAQLSAVIDANRAEIEQRKRAQEHLLRAQGELKVENELRLSAERALVQTQKLEALGQLTGSVAHDFNNLLAVVDSGAHVLRLKHPEVAQTAPLLAIQRAVASGVKLTRQLLAFARRQPVRPQVISLQRWLPETEGLLRASLDGRIRLALQVAPGTRAIKVDSGELEVALINAVVNAKDAIGGSGQGGAIEIQACNVEGEPDFVELTVADDGPGIPEEVRKRVFEPFFTTKEPGRGTGLGLCQVYGMCLQAGGNASIESEPGRGARLRLRFPSAGDEPAREPLSHAPDAMHPLAGHVLLVEDNEEVARASEAVLRSFGLTLERTASADEALAVLAQRGDGFQLVVSDIRMPGSMDGIEMARRLRIARPALQVLLVTGYSERAASAAADGFEILSKPASPAALHAVIAGLQRKAGTPGS